MEPARRHRVSLKYQDCSVFYVNGLSERLVSCLHVMCTALAFGCMQQRPTPESLRRGIVRGNTCGVMWWCESHRNAGMRAGWAELQELGVGRWFPAALGNLGCSCPWNFTPWDSALLHRGEPLFPVSCQSPASRLLCSLLVCPPLGLQLWCCFSCSKPLQALIQLCGISCRFLSVSKWPSLVMFQILERLDLGISPLEQGCRLLASLWIICPGWVA